METCWMHIRVISPRMDNSPDSRITKSNHNGIDNDKDDLCIVQGYNGLIEDEDVWR